MYTAKDFNIASHYNRVNKTHSYIFAEITKAMESGLFERKFTNNIMFVFSNQICDSLRALGFSLQFGSESVIVSWKNVKD